MISSFPSRVIEGLFQACRQYIATILQISCNNNILLLHSSSIVNFCNNIGLLITNYKITNNEIIGIQSSVLPLNPSSSSSAATAATAATAAVAAVATVLQVPSC